MKKMLLAFVIALVFISGFAEGQEASSTLDLETLSVYKVINGYQARQMSENQMTTMRKPSFISLGW